MEDESALRCKKCRELMSWMNLDEDKVVVSFYYLMSVRATKLVRNSNDWRFYAKCRGISYLTIRIGKKLKCSDRN